MIREKNNLPIGVFDSGVGGISVLRELTALLPQEEFYYVGDEANAPYGTKSAEQIRQLTLFHASRMVEAGIKALVVACNTATSAAITLLRETYPDMPIIGIEPALKPAVQIGAHPTVLVMATPGTVNGKKYQELMARFADEARIIPLGCPGLMEFVERGELSGSDLEQYLRALFNPYLPAASSVSAQNGSSPGKIDAIVLGCTHYPFVRPAIRRIVGPEPEILDGSRGCAREVKRRLTESHLLADEKEIKAERPQVTWHMTLPDRETLCQKLLNLAHEP